MFSPWKSVAKKPPPEAPLLIYLPNENVVSIIEYSVYIPIISIIVVVSHNIGWNSQVLISLLIWLSL